MAQNLFEAQEAFMGNAQNTPSVVTNTQEVKEPTPIPVQAETVTEAPAQPATQTAEPSAPAPQEEKKESKMKLIREQLRNLTNSLVETAKNTGRQDVKCNQLLREAYDVIDKTLDTFEGWNEKNYSILRGSKAYVFWGEPIPNKDGSFMYCPVKFMFSQDQVKLNITEFDE